MPAFGVHWTNWIVDIRTGGLINESNSNGNR